MELGGHASHDYDICTCARKHARMLACMHTIFWRAYAPISANLGQIRKIEISMESGGHAGHDYDICAIYMIIWQDVVQEAASGCLLEIEAPWGASIIRGV